MFPKLNKKKEILIKLSLALNLRVGI